MKFATEQAAISLKLGTLLTTRCLHREGHDRSCGKVSGLLANAVFSWAFRPFTTVVHRLLAIEDTGVTVL
jgi:hypothetical protein